MNKCMTAIFGLILLLMTPFHLAAQSLVDKIKADVAKRGTGEKARVKVTDKEGFVTNGYIATAGPDKFEVRTKAGSTETFSYDEVAKVQKPGWSTAAKIGLVVAAAALLVVFASVTGAGDLGP